MRKPEEIEQGLWNIIDPDMASGELLHFIRSIQAEAELSGMRKAARIVEDEHLAGYGETDRTIDDVAYDNAVEDCQRAEYIERLLENAITGEKKGE